MRRVSSEVAEWQNDWNRKAHAHLTALFGRTWSGCCDTCARVAPQSPCNRAMMAEQRATQGKRTSQAARQVNSRRMARNEQAKRNENKKQENRANHLQQTRLQRMSISRGAQANRCLRDWDSRASYCCCTCSWMTKERHR